jgi:signal peptidase I
VAADGLGIADRTPGAGARFPQDVCRARRWGTGADQAAIAKQPRHTPYASGLVSKGSLGCLFEAVETLVLTLVIFFVIQTFVAQPYQVQQMSMENSLQPYQYVLVDKLTPRFGSYHRGDVVVFTPPVGIDRAGGGAPFIKRVIGLPGDTVTIHDGRVYVNDTALDEPYTYPGVDPHEPTDPLTARSEWAIGPGQLFVMGDHRKVSEDSRLFDVIPISSVIGRAWLRYWPLDALGLLPTPPYPGPSATAP